MALVHNNFWCEVLWSSAKGVTSVFDFFGKAKISDAQMAVRRDQKVLRLQITISDLSFVQILEGKSNLSGVKQSHIVRELVFLTE